MKLLDSSVYLGPSLYAHFPVIRMTLDLGELEQWPTVKLGPPFIDDLAGSRETRRLVGSAVLMAHRSGQRVIAQGVEDLATLEQLEDLGIDEAQGYALGPPESLDSLLRTAV